jgi:hypothetical protein
MAALPKKQVASMMNIGPYQKSRVTIINLLHLDLTLGWPNILHLHLTQYGKVLHNGIWQ